MSTNSVTIKMEFSNSPNTRSLTFENVAVDALPNVKSKVQAINTSLANADSAGMLLSAIFVDPKTYDAGSPRSGGNLTRISDATITQTDVTKIPLF